jgi:hypothetical protein
MSSREAVAFAINSSMILFWLLGSFSLPQPFPLCWMDLQLFKASLFVFSEELLRIFGELILASYCTEIVLLPLIFIGRGCFLFLNIHSAYRVFRHRIHLPSFGF